MHKILKLSVAAQKNTQRITFMENDINGDPLTEGYRSGNAKIFARASPTRCIIRTPAKIGEHFSGKYKNYRECINMDNSNKEEEDMCFKVILNDPKEIGDMEEWKNEANVIEIINEMKLESLDDLRHIKIWTENVLKAIVKKLETSRASHEEKLKITKYVFEKTKEIMKNDSLKRLYIYNDLIYYNSALFDEIDEKDLGKNYNLFCKLMITSSRNGMTGKVIRKLYEKKSEYLETLIMTSIDEIVENMHRLSETEKKIMIDKINESKVCADGKFSIYYQLIKSRSGLIKLIDVNSISSTRFLELSSIFKGNDIDYLIDAIIGNKKINKMEILIALAKREPKKISEKLGATEDMLELSTEEEKTLYEIIIDSDSTLIYNVPIEFHTMKMYIKVIDENEFGLYYLPKGKQTEKLILRALKKWGKCVLQDANYKIVFNSEEILQLANKYD